MDIAQLVLSAKEPRGSSLADLLISAAKLSQMDVPAREMVIDPFLPTSSINLLFAQRGIGKTWVGMTIAKDVAAKERFLGFEVPEARGVLYIDGEMPLAVLQERVEAIGADKLDNFYILPSESLFRGSGPLNIHSKEDQARIDAMLDEIDVGLIIFDNFRHCDQASTRTTIQAWTFSCIGYWPFAIGLMQSFSFITPAKAAISAERPASRTSWIRRLS